MDKLLEIRSGADTAFINADFQSSLAYRPQFVSNDYAEGKKVLSSIELELNNCDEFFISVAFITLSGITPLLQTLKELERRHIPGRILTTNYLTFSEPAALQKLNALSNIELRMFAADEAETGFHTKGYIFRRDETYTLIVGSSNMTMSALTKNKEWNTRVVSLEQGEYLQDLRREFESLWASDHTYRYEDFIELYQAQYEIQKQQKRIAVETPVANLEMYRLKPNSMQIAFTAKISNLIEEGAQRALLISATGTGKTFASAFALRDQNPKRVLFLVHREQIAKQAMRSYRLVFGKNKEMGLLSGSSKDYSAEFLFSTMQMMSKTETLQGFDKQHFDMIVVDEVHRAGADSYQRIMEYFKPKFWLGMTASPDRTDGFDIYKLFDHNIAYEIRLQQALEEDLLCPFHYFGITDIEIDGKVLDDQTGVRDFAYLVCDTRVDYIIEQAEYYGHSGNRVKGLAFCSRKEEAIELSKKFNERGLRTAFLCGDDSVERREECVDRLVNDERPDNLDYIFTIDIFNEGVDIPDINQVLMLRPTQSSIIFIQQLGRGLRKANDKEYVVILDFIGNYMNNFMIPVALSGDRSYNKDTVRRYVSEGSRIIPGCSTIHFDEVSRKRIFRSIDEANFNDIKLIKESYQQLRHKLGRIPTLMDFEIHGSIDPVRIFDSNVLGSYHMFLQKYEKAYKVRFDAHKENVLEYISKKFASGKRPHELELLKLLLTECGDVIPAFTTIMQKKYNITVVERTLTNILNILTNEFATGSGKATYKDCIFITGDGTISSEFAGMLADDVFRSEILELVEYGLYRSQTYYGNRYLDTSFQLYSKYTYEDVCRLLEWEKGEVALNIGGYKYDKTTQTYPVFINYDKAEDIADTVRYEDRLTSPFTLIAISKSGRSLDSDDVRVALHAESLGVAMHLFVRKNKDDKISKEFYYLGKVHASGQAKVFTMPNTTKTAVEIEYRLDTPVRDDLYEYITAN